MKIGIIICEYNPLHFGHLWHIEQTKKISNIDTLICIMSGNIVQRGEIAIVDKYTRASWAIQAGADMVVEIPTSFCLCSAEIYAQGAIAVANAISGDKILSFGSEIGNLEYLSKISEIIDSPNTQHYIRKSLDSGNGYATALATAVEEVCKDSNQPHLIEILSSPNNILGIEYLRAITRQNCPMQAITIPRVGAGYNDIDSNLQYPSASAIRNQLNLGNNINQFVPDFVSKNLDTYQNIQSELLSIIKLSLINKDCNKIIGAKDGLDNLIKKHLLQASDLQTLYKDCCSKRYTLATIKRFIMACLCNLTTTASQLRNATPKYLNVLAVRENSTKLFSLFNLPCVTKFSDHTRKDIAIDPIQSASDLLFKSLRYNYNDYMIII